MYIYIHAKDIKRTTKGTRLRGVDHGRYMSYDSLQGMDHGHDLPRDLLDNKYTHNTCKGHWRNGYHGPNHGRD